MTAEQNVTVNDESVQVEQLKPQPVLSIRATIKIDQLTEEMGKRMQAIWAYMQQRGVQTSGPPFVRYHTFGDGETDYEMGMPVAEPVPGEGQIVGGELPGGTAVTTWHVGHHDDKLRAAYARLEAGVKEQGYEPAGASWEVYYWIDPSQPLDTASWPDPSEWRMQIIQPVK